MKVLKVFKDINKREFRLLSIIERQMAFFKFVPIEEAIYKLSPFSQKLTDFTLQKLLKKELILFKQAHYLGTVLTFSGYDALALKSLLEQKIISEVGPEIGAGKESDVRLVRDDNGNDMILKVHRLGTMDFRNTKRARGFIAEKKHLSVLYQSRLSATREFTALNDLFKESISVPQPKGHSRHMVVQEIIEGQDLYKIKKNQFNIKTEIPILLENILSETEKAVKVGYIHGDLSEYNIRLDNNKDDYPVLFDWPQYVEVSAQNAEEILEADLTNVLNYFNQKFKYSINIDLPDLISQFLDK